MLQEPSSKVSLTVNGRRVDRTVPDRMLLVDLLRDELGLFGTRVGCEEGICGACSVAVDGHVVKSCSLLAVQTDGTEVETVECLSTGGGGLDPIQAAFVACGALQCGYCTSGMIMAARDLLARVPRPTEEEIRYALSGNLCRCTGYAPIVRAVLVASGQAEPQYTAGEGDGGSWIGRPIPRKEDNRLVAGAGRYTDNVVEPGTLHCAILRSTHAHARILAIDAWSAANLSGVVKVVTGREAEPFWTHMPPTWDATGAGGKLPMNRAIAVDKVRFVGEPVAAVLAENRAVAEDALALIRVEYEPLPAVLSLQDALGTGDARPRALLYDAWGDNLQLVWPDRIGDVEATFASAHLVLEDAFSSQRYSTMPLETRAVHARFDVADRALTVHLSTQIPHHARSFFAHVFGLPEANVRVVAGDVGGGFGGKLALDTEYIPVLLSVMTGRPVKWMETRSEWMAAGPHARDFAMRVRAAFAEDGTLLALRTDIDADMGCDGAERAGGLGMPCMAGIYAPGGYKLDTYEMNVRCFVTNKAPYGACRGYGKDIANMAMERMLDLGADRLGLSRFEVRRRNLTATYPHPLVTGPVIESGSLVQALDRLEALMDIGGLTQRQHEARRGGRHLGFAAVSYIEPCGGSIPNSMYQNYESASVRIAHDGTVRVLTGIQSIGQGVLTSLALVAAETLGCSPDNVHVSCGDTDAVPYGVGAYSGRGAIYGVGAVLLAAGKVRERAIIAAAFLLQADRSKLVLKGGKAFDPERSDRSVTLKEIARAVYFWPGAELSLKGVPDPSLEAQAVYTSPQTSWQPDERGRFQLYTSHPGGAVGALVEVDVETGEVQVLQFWVVADHGRIIHPPSVDGQIVGGTVQQLGGTLLEEIAYDREGRPMTRSLRDYGLVNAIKAASKFVIEHIETPSPATTVGAKGAGESGCIATTTVLMAAVENALAPFGVRVTHSPLTPWNVRELVRTSVAPAPARIAAE